MRSSAKLLLTVAIAFSLAAVVPTLAPAQGSRPALRFLGFSPTQPPADSLVFRQAVAYAIDREGIVRAVSPYRADASLALTIQHPRLPGYNAAVRGYPYDPAKARELYAQSGWTGPIMVMVPATSALWETFNNAVADSIRKALGAAVTLQVMTPFSVLVDAVKAGRAATYTYGWASDPRDFGYPSFALGLAHDNNIADLEVRALVEKRDVNAVEQMLLDKALIVPIVYYVSQ